MGRKTSVYLSDEISGRVKASGLPIAELVRRGLDAGEPPELEATLRRVIRQELASPGHAGLPAQPADDEECPHPKARINKGLCGNCGTYVGTRTGGK